MTTATVHDLRRTEEDLVALKGELCRVLYRLGRIEDSSVDAARRARRWLAWADHCVRQAEQELRPLLGALPVAEDGEPVPF